MRVIYLDFCSLKNSQMSCLQTKAGHCLTEAAHLQFFAACFFEFLLDGVCFC